ncbi:MAG: DNA primase [Deltaproteobacteria bacterium]|nr:DNA primase [Deltaproteobacteria bacterium]
MIIPQDKIDEIRERANIVEVISEYVPLRKNGKNHIGLCPFHSEKTPSFTVNDEKQIFYCFGCGTGGNVFTFLIKQENLSFPEAVRTVAKRIGIDLSMLDKKPSVEERQREIMFLANHAAQDFYQRCLLTSPDAEKARLYVKKRGLKPEIIKNFNIGYGPPGRDSLAKFLASKGISLEMAEKAGLVSRKDKDFHDKFRNRVMFPITDVRNRVIGFGGRALGNEEPKYLNSPASPLFKKGETLYGMYQAKSSVSNKGFVLVVEGYFDLLTMHQYGFLNTVATLGTALTTDHLRKLKGYAKEVYTLFDSDEAGKAASIRSLPMFIQEDMHARVVLMPAGMDPDDLLQKQGAQAMSQCIEKAKPIMNFFLDSVRTKFDIETPNGKVSFLETAAPYVASLKNAAERDVYVEKIANILHIRPDAVLSTIRAAAEIKGQESRVKSQKHQPPAANEIINKQDTTRVEETILKIALLYPHLYTESVKDAVEMFKIDFLKEAGRLIIDALQKRASSGQNSIDLSAIIDSTTSDKARMWLLKASVEEDESIKEDTEKILEDCCKKVAMASKLKKETSLLLKKLEEAGKKGDIASDGYKSAAESYISMKRS